MSSLKRLVRVLLFVFVLYAQQHTTVALEKLASLLNLVTKEGSQTRGAGKPINVLLILADDLGFSDTSVWPFIGNSVLTPELERMASRGMVLTNFHTAAATCTPTRASILTGLYPWRLGIKAVFEYGLKGKSNRDDWMPQLPNVAMAFKDANYSTGHSGKWHVGGMRNDDLDMRLLPVLNKGFDNRRGKEGGSGRRCPHPGPNQQGFDEYVSVLDGPGSPRQNELQVGENLYTQGCAHLLRNDESIGRQGAPSSIVETLSDCEARHAIRMMKEAVRKKRPFYQQVWFHAPHGPWEEVPGWKHLYPEVQKPLPHELQTCAMNKTTRYCSMGSGKGKRLVDRGMTRLEKYRTMISSMDKAIGSLLNALREMGIEKETLVVFTSDNGPEDDAGPTRINAGEDKNPYPDWTGFYTPSWYSGYMRGSKRYLYEGGIRVPTIFQWVGTIPKGKNSSVFAASTDLLPTFLDAAGVPLPSNYRVDGMSLLPELIHQSAHSLYKVDHVAKRRARRMLADRVTMWHNDYEGPRLTLARVQDFKFFLNGSEYPSELFDLRTDPHEARNLLPRNMTKEMILRFRTKKPFTLRSLSDPQMRSDPELHIWLVSKLYSTLFDFATHGDEAFQMYMTKNVGRVYNATVESDLRYIRTNIYAKIRLEDALKLRYKLFNGTCTTPCPCETQGAKTVPGFAFSRVEAKRAYLQPKGFFNASSLF